jgi:2-methylcitrate dehydratase PrpD
MLLVQLAERTKTIRLAKVSHEALEAARSAILDTIGVALAGSQEDCVRFVRAAIGPVESGAASIFGARSTASTLDAATINGTAAHALDFDDCSNTMGGHPSAPIVPALFALAEREGVSGSDFLTAYIAGFEVETKLGRAVNFHHYEKGWHPTATLGTFGAAAACAYLLDLPADRFANALALAASMAAGIKANFGTMAKPFHVGQAARNGLFAALMASEGVTANPAALEDAQGFFHVYNGEGTFDPARLFEGFAAPFDLTDPGVAFKRHPCCASTHPAADALLAIMSEHALTAASIAAVRSWTHPRRLRHTNRPNPQSGLDAKFSVQYVLARAALDGVVRLDHFTDAAVRDPVARSFMERVEAAPHPEAVMDTTEHFFAEVQVTTADGGTFSAFVDRPLGRDRDHPLPIGALQAKFRDCAGKVLEPQAVAALEQGLLELESVRDMREIGRIMRALREDKPIRRAG